MPGYANIGGSWRELSGGGYANIGGSWRQISEGYQNRGGVWEKVFPNYKDYGGDTPRLDTNGFIDLYGYIADSASTSSTRHSTVERSTSSSRASFGSGSSFGSRYFYYSTAELFDARGYNYMAFPMQVSISTDESSSGNSHNFSIYPIVSFASAPNVGTSYAETNIQGSSTSGNVTYDKSYGALTLVDLTNCDVTDLYLRIGYMYGSTWSSSSYTGYGYLNLPNNDTYGIYLYRNKSECPFSGSNYQWSWTLTY